MKNIEVKLFLLIAFFIGTWGALFDVAQTVVIAVGLLYNIVKYKKDFLNNLSRYKYYVAIPLGALVYMGIHTLIIVNTGKYAEFKPGYGLFEKISFFFLLVVLYVTSAKSFITVKHLKQFLWCFCISVFTFNLVVLFQLTGTDLFTNTKDTVDYLYNSRFGGTKYLFNGKVYLDAQALQIYAAALISYFLCITQHTKWKKGMAFILFITLVWFLSLTVTKSSILSFISGFVLFNFYFLRKFPLKLRWGLVVVFLVVGVTAFIFRPDSFDQRWQQAIDEIQDVRNGNLEGGGSIVPRYVFYQSCFDHIDTWGIWGLGVYTNPVSKQWYINSGNAVVAALVHSHNSYLQYWMLMGIVGLLFILNWFILPVVKMVCSKQFSFLALSLLTAFFIDSNFEVLLIVTDGLGVVIFFLAMFYLFADKFHALEEVQLSVKS